MASAMLFPYVFIFKAFFLNVITFFCFFIVVIQEENKDIRVSFCTKDTPTENESDWPVGNYCILRYGELCPDGKYCELIKAVILFINMLI